MDGCIGFQPKQLRDLDGSRFTDAAQIVAKQVHNHDVFGAILRAADQFCGEGGVLQRVLIPRAGPFDWSGFNLTVRVDMQEPFRGGGEHRFCFRAIAAN